MRSLRLYISLPIKTSVLWGLTVAFLAGLCTYNTILNMYYATGATLQDASVFGTLIWRSGLELLENPAVGGRSFYVSHVSSIHYIPSLISYIYPWDRITYYGFVYAAVTAALIWNAYTLIVSIASGRWGALIAGIAVFALFCSQSMFQGAWEPHVEQVSPLFALLAFLAWQRRAYCWAMFWLFINATIREDLGALYAVPVGLLAFAQYMELRVNDPILANEKKRWGYILVGFSMGCTLLAFAFQSAFYPQAHLVSFFYFDTEHPFAHLSRELLLKRYSYMIEYRHGIWLPLLALAMAAVVYKDMPLLVGSVCFLPYVFIFSLGKIELAAIMDTYRPFPFVLAMLWPSLIAMGRPIFLWRRYLLLQLAVLALGLTDCGTYGPDAQGKSTPYIFTQEASKRWVRNPLSYHGERYHQFGATQLDDMLSHGPVRASHAILALYPYKFPIYTQSGVQYVKEEDMDHVKTVVWFENDRDQQKVNQLLARGKFTITSVPGTMIRFATKAENQE